MKIMPDLSQFTGTENYHKLTLGNLKFTDGLAFLAQEVGCFWLGDIISSVQHLDKIKESPFIVWIIKVKKQVGLVSAYSDCNEDVSYSKDKLLYEQKLPYTDFPEGEFEFYQCNDVVLLKSEY